MDSYEARLVQDIVAAGDLAAVEKLFRSLLAGLGSLLPRVRNPRRAAWVFCWIEGLGRIADLPAAPAVFSNTQTDPLEVELCARRVVESGTFDTFLWLVARELSSLAVTEPDPVRRIWMARAAEILLQTVTASPPSDLEWTAPDPMAMTFGDETYPLREHRGVTMVAGAILGLAGLFMVGMLGGLR